MNLQRWRKSMYFFPMVILLLWGGCAVNPVTGRSELAFMEISPAQAAALGKPAFQQALQKGGGPYADESLAAYVNSVGQRLAEHSPRSDMNFRFAVINDSAPNAFALPGGYITITRGLLAQLSNEAELAAVLGHEMGHVTARPGLQGLQKNTLLRGPSSLLSGVAAAAG